MLKEPMTYVDFELLCMLSSDIPEEHKEPLYAQYKQYLTSKETRSDFEDAIFKALKGKIKRLNRLVDMNQ